MTVIVTFIKKIIWISLVFYMTLEKVSESVCRMGSAQGPRS